jgi:uncharacterized MAPEG superfamily protein
MGVFGGTIEIQMLCWSIVLGLLQIVVSASLSTWQRGFVYNIGPRDAPLPDANAVTQRLERALKNFLETFVFFAAAVLVVTLLNKESETSALGAQIYFWARLLFVPAYGVGVPFLRTAVWSVAMIGLVMVVVAAAA